MAERQYSTPMIIEDGEAIRLNRIPLAEKSHPESWLQELHFVNPSLLPIAEIEPAFDGLLPVARELRTSAGPADLVFLNPDGMITVAETKLWRNPEARREVVAQVIDYAKDMAHWSYNDLVRAVHEANGITEGNLLVDLASEASEHFDEAVFTDRVTRNLGLGRFLLLVVGDGIREGVEEMANFLQKTPNLGFTLALVEIALFRKSTDKNGTIIVQPRILARTVEVERAVVTIRVPIDSSAIEVTLPPDEGKDGMPGKRTKITEQEFYEQLAESAGPDVVDFARWTLEQADAHDLQIRWLDAGPMLKYVHEETDREFSLGQFSRRGKLEWTLRLYQWIRKAGLPSTIYTDFIDDLAQLIPGASRRIPESGAMKKKGFELLLMDNGGDPPLSLLAPHRMEWMAAIDKVVERIRHALE